MNAVITLLSAVLALAGAAEPQSTLRGTVKQTLDAGPYIYLLVSTPEGEKWAAVVKTPLKTGDKVAVTQDTVMEKFESKTLKRTFDRVVFGSLESAPPASPHAKSAGHAKSAAGPVKPVAKASGADAYTVAELFSKKAELKGKTVAVRGKVVKFNAQIMGVNWLHLRDGSGSEKGQDNDITVMAKDSAAVGDVVTARGAVTLDKDLGAGYFYPLIIEGAQITKP